MSLLSIFSPTGVKSSVWVNLVMIGTEELFFRQERICPASLRNPRMRAY